MSTSKYINKICVAVIILTLVFTILFMCGESLGISASPKTAKYESTIFDTSYVHRIDIVMNDWDSFLETCENEEYATCTVVVDGQKHSNIAIRAKGNTSLSTVNSMGSQRYSFKLEFDHYEQAKMLDGLDKLCLNNLIQDNTMMKDYIVYQMMTDFGVDAPLCSFAYLTVNGEDWGLYLAVEGIEDSFLSRNYGTEVGDLYKPDSMSFGGGRGNGMGFNFDDLDFDFGFGNMKDDTESEDASQAAETESAIAAEDSEEAAPPEEPENAAPSNEDMQPGGDMPTPPKGQMPEGFDPGSMSQEDFDPGSMFQGDLDPSSMFQEDTTEDGSSESDTQPGGFSPGGDMPTLPNGQMPGNMGGSMPGNMGGGMPGGMGSDDVKLQYIDDDPESYANIFDNAKTAVSSADEDRLIESLKKLSSYTDLEDVLDMEEVLRYFVVHNFVCNGDSYTGSMIHNYYLHEGDGKLGMIPWDYNLAFGTFQGNDASGTINTSIDSPISGGNMDDRPMVGWIFSDEQYTEAYHELFSEFIDKWFTNGELETMIAETAEMLRPYVEKDPTKFCTTEEFDEGVEALSQFVSLRAEAVSSQLDGDTTPVDTGDLDLSAMGTMGGGMGGNPFGGGDRPEPPDGNGSDQGGFMPGGDDSDQGGFMPGGDDSERSSFTPGGNDSNQGSSMPGGRPENMPGAMSSGNSMKSFLIMTGISALVLLIGIIIAAKKK